MSFKQINVNFTSVILGSFSKNSLEVFSSLPNLTIKMLVSVLATVVIYMTGNFKASGV